MFRPCIELSLPPAVVLLADEGYESGSNEDLPTPLWQAPRIHHVSSMEHASFYPIYSTPH